MHNTVNTQQKERNMVHSSKGLNTTFTYNIRRDMDKKAQIDKNK